MLIQQYRSLLHEDALDDGLLALLEDLLQLGLARLAKTPHQHGAVSGDQAVSHHSANRQGRCSRAYS